uniref:Uncharacterized protein n=1 Tax=Rhizophora mucronata TaxID=61149 RepID=A0A2P2J0A6_RHIMU
MKSSYDVQLIKHASTNEIFPIRTQNPVNSFNNGGYQKCVHCARISYHTPPPQKK